MWRVYCPGGDPIHPVFPTPYLTTNQTDEFIQDEISLVKDRLALITGIKLDQNPYTGLEYQPTARLLYTPDNKQTLWGAISLAV